MRTSLILAAWVWATANWCQAMPDSLWLQPLGAGNECLASAVRLTADDGYLLAGTEASPTGEMARMVRTDSSGHVLWSREFCDAEPLKVRDVCSTQDGDIFVVGTAGPTAADSQQSFVLRANALGDTVWMRLLGETAGGANVVQPAADGGCVLAGWSADTGSGGLDIGLQKVAANGELIWRRTFGGAGDEWAVALRQASDGDWIVAGQGMSESRRDLICLLRTDSAGVLRWFRTYPLTGLQKVYDMECLPDGGVMIAGLFDPPGRWGDGYFLANVDSGGNPLELHSLGARGRASDRVMLRSVGGGFVLASFKVSLGAGAREIELFKIDEDGELQYRQNYDGAGYNRRESHRHYWNTVSAAPFADGLYDVFRNSYPPIEERISIAPPAPLPQRSHRHAPYDSFSNAYFASFAVNRRQPVSITVHDTTGRLIQTVADESYGTGLHCEVLDGWSLPVGIYFLRIETAHMLEVKKVALVR